MDILIKGMDMPISCCNCILSKLSPTGQTLICNYTLSTVPWDDKPFDCPLVSVPPHGELIEKGYIIGGLKAARSLVTDETGLYLMERHIQNATIIIPASEV